MHSEEQCTPQCFTYQWCRVTDSAQKMDWITITEQDDCPEEHIHLHQLTRSTDLQLLMATLDDSSAAALLLINTKNSYEIDGRYFPPGEIVWPVPVMVVTADTGKRVRSFVNDCQSGGEAEALVDIEPSPQLSEWGTSTLSTYILEFYRGRGNLGMLHSHTRGDVPLPVPTSVQKCTNNCVYIHVIEPVVLYVYSS